MDVQGAEGMVKVWERKHEEDIQAMGYHHPNVLVTAAYDGDLIVWSTETSQPACRMNCQENSKPMLGSERPKRVDSQRTLIAKKFKNLTRRATEAVQGSDKRKLQFVDEKDSLPALVLQPADMAGWSRRPPVEITGSTAEDSTYFTIPADLPHVSTDNQNSPKSSETSQRLPRRCTDCFGYKVQNEQIALEHSITAYQLCCCGESSFLSLTLDNAPKLCVTPPTISIRNFIESTAVDGTALSNVSNQLNTGKLEPPLSPSSSLKLTEEIIWRLRTGSYLRRKSADHRTSMQRDSSLDPMAIRGPQKLITSTCIECLVVLNNRKVDKRTAVVFVGGQDGWIRAWSLHYKGGLLGQFRGSNRPQDAVTCMAVDEKNHYLFSGDAYGYIKVWFIGDYCVKTPYTSTLSNKEKEEFIEAREKKYQYFISNKFFRRFSQRQSKRAEGSINPPPTASDPERTVHKPVLLTSFRGHLKAVTCIEFVDTYELVISGSEDHNIRVWTMAGKYAGQLGTHTWPKLIEGSRKSLIESSEYILPADVRRVATPRTLRVFYGGISKRWKLLRNGVRLLIGPWFRLGFKRRASSDRSPKKDKGKKNASRSSILSPHSSKRSISPRSRTPAKSAGPTADELAIPKPTYQCNAETSSVLGKSYKKRGRHRTIPKYSNMYGPGNAMHVWMKLKTSDLEEVNESGPPHILLAREKRRSKYINQLIKARAARKVLAENVLAGTYNKVPSDPSIPLERTIIINPPSPTKAGTKANPKKQNPFMPASVSEKTEPKIKGRPSRTDLETVTIDKLSLEICEIMGEASEYGEW